MSPRKPTIDDLDDVDDEDGAVQDDGDYPSDLVLDVRRAAEVGLGGTSDDDVADEDAAGDRGDDDDGDDERADRDEDDAEDER